MLWFLGAIMVIIIIAFWARIEGTKTGWFAKIFTYLAIIGFAIIIAGIIGYNLPQKKVSYKSISLADLNLGKDKIIYARLVKVDNYSVLVFASLDDPVGKTRQLENVNIIFEKRNDGQIIIYHSKFKNKLYWLFAVEPIKITYEARLPLGTLDDNNLNIRYPGVIL